MKTIHLMLAGHLLAYKILCEKTAYYLECFPGCVRKKKDRNAEAVFALTEEERRRAKLRYPEESTEVEVELGELMFQTSAFLLSVGAVLFHGVAFLWQGKAYIFTAPSGVGKSTQYFQWKLRYGDEVGILNGDKPVLGFDDGVITVYPSPWTGKEHIGRDITAPLGGIVWLEQADDNSLDHLSKMEAVAFLFHQFLVRLQNAAEVKSLCRILEGILETVPVWRLKNKGDPASAELLHDALIKESEDEI